MDKIFAHTEEQSTKATRSTERKSLDIALMEAKETRLAARRQRAQEEGSNTVKSMVEVKANPANVGRRRSTTAEDDTTADQHRRETMASKMTLSAADDPPVQARASKALPAND